LTSHPRLGSKLVPAHSFPELSTVSNQRLGIEYQIEMKQLPFGAGCFVLTVEDNVVVTKGCNQKVHRQTKAAMRV
jgi:hypothetical protein